jgi:predicted MFS family arabinose efflux permease
MLRTAFQRYTNNFKGFSREIWILSIVTFINRAGVMVIPFLSKYLKENLHFSYGEVGWIMVSFGVGSLTGSWLGGKLSDKIGFYKVMVYSLFTSGVLFFGLQYITSFWGLCFGLFTIMAVADMFRPAMFVSIRAYAKPEIRTRALTLVRLAINLGFAAGPALGGLIIMNIGYKGLFWIDGATCIIAILLFAILVKERKKPMELSESKQILENQSVFKDKPFRLFMFISFVMGMIFFQLFTSLPLYYKEMYDLTEFQTGLLMTLNGLIIFFLEMPMVGFFERKKIKTIRIILWATFLMSISYLLLLFTGWAGILILFMVAMTLGEMMGFPFTNTFAMSRATRGNEGRYMALYSMSFSMAHIVSGKLGLEIISHFGYKTNWLFMAIIGLIAVYCATVLQKQLKKEATNTI